MKIDAFNSNYIEYESNSDKDKILTIKEYLDMIKPYLSDMINSYITQDEWKIQLTIVINFISSKGSDETRIMHSKSDNIDIMMGSETDRIIEDFFETLLQQYQNKFRRINDRKRIYF